MSKKRPEADPGGSTLSVERFLFFRLCQRKLPRKFSIHLSACLIAKREIVETDKLSSFTRRGPGHVQLLHRNVQRFRSGLVFKARRLLYHSTPGLRVIKLERERGMTWGVFFHVPGRVLHLVDLESRLESCKKMICRGSRASRLESNKEAEDEDLTTFITNQPVFHTIQGLHVNVFSS